MKVLMLTREYPPDVYGGAGVVAGELSRALSRRMDVEVRCWGSGNRRDGKIDVRGYEGWERLAARDGKPPFALPLSALSVNLAMVRDAVDADVVHAHTWYADMGGYFARMLYDIPLVVTLHSMEPLRPWKAEQVGTGYSLSSWIEKIGVETADRVVAVSKLMKEDILAHYDVDPERVVVIHNGIDLQLYRRTEERDALLEYGVRPPYVLFVGRITYQKGIFKLLEAARSLPKGVQVVLCAASPDTPEIESRLRETVAGREEVVWIDDMLDKKEVIQLYSHAAVFCCPSVYEPFGIINLEAMACETAVVASSVGGILEVVEDGETGLLVPPSDSAALAKALTTLLEDPGLARTMGRAGRERVERRFSWDAVAARTEALYEDARSEGARSGG